MQECDICVYRDYLPDYPPCDTCSIIREETGIFPTYMPEPPKEENAMAKYIDADKLKAHYAWWGEDSSERTLFDAIIDVQPAADVRPVVKARWIHMPSDGKFRDTCVCSACKKSPPIESWIVQGFNACPYCFADMREEN